jgi:hypothetical protein
MPPGKRTRLGEISSRLKENDIQGARWLIIKAELVAEAKGIFDAHSGKTETWGGWCEQNDMDRSLSYHLISIWERFSTASGLLENFSVSAIRHLGVCSSDQPAKHAIILATDGEFVSFSTAKQIVSKWTEGGAAAMSQAADDDEADEAPVSSAPAAPRQLLPGGNDSPGGGGREPVRSAGGGRESAPAINRGTTVSYTPATTAKPIKESCIGKEFNPINQIIRAKEKINQLMRILDEEDLKPTLGQRWNAGLVNLCDQLLKSLGDAEKNVYRKLEQRQGKRN